MQTLRRDDRGEAVKELQALLNKILAIDPPLMIDGHFGPKTEAAVKQFQATCNIGIDGVVGPITWKTIQGAENNITPNEPTEFSTDAIWMKHAGKEIGQREISGDAHNPRIIAYHATTTLAATTDEVPWCSSFVNWTLKQAGIQGTNSAAAASWLDWATSTAPKPGAITIIKNETAANSKHLQENIGSNAIPACRR